MQETGRSQRSTAKFVAEYSPKDRIAHFRFGLGTIVTINEIYTTIEFDEPATPPWYQWLLPLILALAAILLATR